MRKGRLGWTSIPSLVLRGLGVVYLLAFRSLRRQVRGLYGSGGVLPVAARASRGPGELPSVLWLAASDRALVRWCAAGEACGAALALGVVPRAAAAGAWAIYSSFVRAGVPFLAYQWDVLLLEAGLAGVVVAPGGLVLRPWRVSWARMLLFRLLAVRVHLESGVAKLQSRDQAWRRLFACAHHFQTQPLPTPLGWRAHQSPRWWHRAATAAVLALECGAPLLALGPRRARQAGWALLTGLQAGIAATGNYAFFNVLSAVLALSLLDQRRPRERGRRAPWWKRAWAAPGAVAAAGLGALSLAALARRVAPAAWRARWMTPVERAARRIQAVNNYGLFSVMTRRRREVVIEGSDDGVAWKGYELPCKPGNDLRRAPRWVAPHQPRLDWQLWFAALGAPPPWFELLLVRLLEGQPEVLALFAHDPFPARPPRQVRALLYDYRMTDAQTRRRTGAWWRRRLVRLYHPAVQLAPGPVAATVRSAKLK